MSDNTGAMIAHFPDQALNLLVEIAAQHFPGYAVPGSDMHLTLAYLGEAADLGDDDEMEMSNELDHLASKLSPLQGSINGITRFLDSDPNPVVVNFDARGFSTLRKVLLNSLRGQGVKPVLNHGFTPHITLAYLPADKQMPDVKFSPIPVTLNSLSLAVGQVRTDFPLRGDVALSEAKHMSKFLSESGVYDVSVGEDADDQNGDNDNDQDDVDLAELTKYVDGVSESVPKGAPSSDFADPPSGLYVGDAKHAALAVQAVTSGFRGNKAKARGNPGVKSRIASAVRKFYSGAMQKYYLTWLNTGKKPGQRPTSESRVMHEMYMAAPGYSVEDEVRFPNVPTSPNVNLAELMAVYKDTEPCFVTRPLAILGEVSDNGLPYNQALCDDVFNQVNSKRPVGRRGHVSEADKSSLFPPDDAYWIGAVWDSTVYGKPVVFGKAYVVPGETRDMVLSRRATGTALSNSLWGDVTTSEDENGNIVPLGVEIESIDFVPAERAALQALGGSFMVTSEMKGSETMAGTKEAMQEAISAIGPNALHEMMSEAQRHHVAEAHVREGKCSECAPDKMNEMLSEAHRAHITEARMHEETPEETYKHMDDGKRKSVAEMYAKEMNMRLAPHEEESVKEESMQEMKTLKSSLSEMQKELSELRREKFEGELDKAVDTYFAAFHVNTPKGQEGLANLKSTLRFRALSEMAGMKDGQIAANIAAATEAAWPHVKPLTEMFVASAGGPAAVVGNNDNGSAQIEAQAGWDAATGRYKTEAAKEARNRANW